MRKPFYFLFLKITFISFCLACISFGQEEEVIKPPKKGYVTLSKEEYKSLIEKLKPLKKEAIKPPQDWIVESAVYDITIYDGLKLKGAVGYTIESLRSDIWVQSILQRSSAGLSINTPPDGLTMTYKDGTDLYFGTNLARQFKVSCCNKSDS